MFKLKFSNLYQNQIYTKYGIEFTKEDHYYIEDNIFCVADGVTRDLIGGEASIYPKTKEEAIFVAKNYPNPSGALTSAKIIANNFVKYMKEKEAKQENIIEAIQKANKDVWEINKTRKIDYIEEDLYCSEAAGGVITDDFMYCFSIGDCYIKVFDEKYNEIFCTQNDHLCLEEFEKEFLKSGEYNWSNPRYRLLVRGALRNNNMVTFNGKKVGFGALTGEDKAMDFVKVYQVPLKNAKYICAYSDGCMPFFANKEEVEKTLLNPNRIEENGSERTIVIYEKD